MHIMTEEELNLQVAEEFVDRDQLRVYKRNKPLPRLTFWQIVMILATLVLANDQVFFGSDLHPQGNYEDICQAQFSSVVENGNILGLIAFENYENLQSPTKINVILVAFLLIHVFDLLLIYLTEDKCLCWRVLNPEERKKLWDPNDTCQYWMAWTSYSLLHVIRIIVMTCLVLPVLPQKVCQPFIVVTIYQDYFFTIALSIWVILEG